MRVCGECHHVEPGCVCEDGPPTRPTSSVNVGLLGAPSLSPGAPTGLALPGTTTPRRGLEERGPFGAMMATSLEATCSFCLEPRRRVHCAVTDRGSVKICLDCADEAVRHLMPQIVAKGRPS